MFKKLKSQVQEAVSTAAQLANTSLSAATSNNLEVEFCPFIRDLLFINSIFLFCFLDSF